MNLYIRNSDPNEPVYPKPRPEILYRNLILILWKCSFWTWLPTDANVVCPINHKFLYINLVNPTTPNRLLHICCRHKIHLKNLCEPSIQPKLAELMCIANFIQPNNRKILSYLKNFIWKVFRMFNLVSYYFFILLFLKRKKCYNCYYSNKGKSMIKII